MKKRVSVVITDLDDTLWDWVAIWHHPFKAMLDRLVEDSGVPRNQLIKEFKQVHTNHGTSEYTFAIEELPSLIAKHPGEDLAKVYKDAIEAYQLARREVLRLYPAVRETLEAIKDKGALVVGYTESLAFHTSYRLRKFDLDRTLDYLYSPADHELPDGKERDNIRRYAPEHYDLRRTVLHPTPPGKQKPSAQVLLSIIEDIGARPEETIYVGDKLVKDVCMAQAAGVTDVHAQYGEAHTREEYELLRQVTHWSPEAVRKEKETTAEDVCPRHTLRKSFGELLELFDFAPFLDTSERRLGFVVDAWKKAVDVQQHFNEIEMKIRNYAITVFVAVLGAAGFALKEKLPVLAASFPFMGVLGMILFWFMDEFWYHRLLKGAVEHASTIERRYSGYLPEIGLSRAIGKASPAGTRKRKLHSTGKLRCFYLGMMLVLVIAGVLVLFFAPTGKPGGSATRPAGNQVETQSMDLGRDPGPARPNGAARDDAVVAMDRPPSGPASSPASLPAVQGDGHTPGRDF